MRTLIVQLPLGSPTPNTVYPYAEVQTDTRDGTDYAFNAAYEAKWQEGGSISYLYTYTDLLVNKEANDTASEFARNKIRGMVKDPATAELLAPKDHPIGTKRLCLDTGYYETYNRPNVTLVDVRADPIERVVPEGVMLRSVQLHARCRQAEMIDHQGDAECALTASTINDVAGRVDLRA